MHPRCIAIYTYKRFNINNMPPRRNTIGSRVLSLKKQGLWFTSHKMLWCKVEWATNVEIPKELIIRKLVWELFISGECGQRNMGDKFMQWFGKIMIRKHRQIYSAKLYGLAEMQSIIFPNKNSFKGHGGHMSKFYDFLQCLHGASAFSLIKIFHDGPTKQRVTKKEGRR